MREEGVFDEMRRRSDKDWRESLSSRVLEIPVECLWVNRQVKVVFD